MKRFGVVPLIIMALLLMFYLGCEPEEPYPPPNIDHDFGEMTDPRDGQTYKTIEIGPQTWMAENLKYLPSVSPSSEGSRTTPYYYVYGYEGTTVSDAKATDNFKTYGVLYNWTAALNVCPDGWHLPDDAEWTTLTNFLGNNAGGKMKSTILWDIPNTGATNGSGFSGLPGGSGGYFGNFHGLGNSGNWWSASIGFADFAMRWFLYYYHGSVYRYYGNKERGYSVRCIRD